ncbi:MAG: hypothetical protein RL681_632 [Candidatus Parcubacteria bacterium]|jgi:NAD(P)-dependent dehydrogenase (short-subunit alcohol dehydrogenase family)
MDIKDNVAIVTGGRQGIGLGIVLALADEGCHVVVADMHQEDCAKAAQEAEKRGVQAIGVVCDVTKKNDVDGLVAKTIEKFGRLDILVNNAGIYPFKPFAEMEEADWDKVMNVNLKGVFLMTKAALPHLKEGAKIVNVSSIASVVGFAGLVHYCATKGGVNGMVRALALELAPRKINVNAVLPGAIETPGASGGLDDKAKTAIASGIPWKQMGQPADIAHAVVFLASHKADYITGQTLIVDGGWTIQ